MSKTDQRGRTKSKRSFVNLPFDMVNSPAFLALPPAAVALYIHVACRYSGDNNGQISFSTREAADRLRVSKNTAAHLFRELVDKGFLKLAHDSSFGLKMKLARRWELTQWQLKHGMAPGNDWRYWQAQGAPAQQRAIPTPDMASGKHSEAEEVKCSG